MDAHVPQYRPPTIYQGYSNDYLRNKERNFLNRTQGLNFGPQGFHKVRPASAQAAFIADELRIDTAQFGDLVKLGCLNPEFYKTPLDRANRRTLHDESVLLKEKNSESTPVLRFYAYNVDVLPQEKPFLEDNYRVRKFVLYFYTADNTIKVWENRQINSGFVQGDYLRRARYEIPGKENVCYSWFDFNVGLDIDLSGHLFHIYDADGYTRHFFEYSGATVKKAEDCPTDPYLKYRTQQASHGKEAKESKEDKLSRFIRTDGQRLSFEVVVDDSVQKAGDIRRMVLRYYIYDETLELMQIPTKNSGYDPARAVIRKQRIPKNFYNDLVLQIGDQTVPNHYTASDLKLGKTLLLFGRKATLCDCDEYTEKWLRQNMNFTEFNRVDSATLIPQHPPLHQPELAPWKEGNRQGGYLDSLQNCLHLDPQPKVYNDLQKMYHAGEILRFKAKLVTQEPEEKDRRFIFCYSIGEGSLEIYEEAVPAHNILKQTFLKRCQLRKVGMDNPPVYFTEQDFTIGSVHSIFGRLFEIYNCDEHVIKFALANPNLYKPTEIDCFREAVAKHSHKKPAAELSDHVEPADTVDEKITLALIKLKRWQKVSHKRLYQLFLELDTEKTDIIDMKILCGMASQLGVSMEEDVLKGVFRQLGAGENCVMEFTRFLHGLNMLWRGVRQQPFGKQTD